MNIHLTFTIVNVETVYTASAIGNFSLKCAWVFHVCVAGLFGLQFASFILGVHQHLDSGQDKRKWGRPCFGRTPDNAQEREMGPESVRCQRFQPLPWARVPPSHQGNPYQLRLWPKLLIGYVSSGNENSGGILRRDLTDLRTQVASNRNIRQTRCQERKAQCIPPGMVSLDDHKAVLAKKAATANKNSLFISLMEMGNVKAELRDAQIFPSVLASRANSFCAGKSAPAYSYLIRPAYCRLNHTFFLVARKEFCSFSTRTEHGLESFQNKGRFSVIRPRCPSNHSIPNWVTGGMVHKKRVCCVEGATTPSQVRRCCVLKTDQQLGWGGNDNNTNTTPEPPPCSAWPEAEMAQFGWLESRRFENFESHQWQPIAESLNLHTCFHVRVPPTTTARMLSK